jgi:hypothetical protein
VAPRRQRVIGKTIGCKACAGSRPGDLLQLDAPHVDAHLRRRGHRLQPVVDRLDGDVGQRLSRRQGAFPIELEYASCGIGVQPERIQTVEECARVGYVQKDVAESIGRR